MSKLIYTHANRLLVENAKNMLENEGLEVELRKDFLGAGAGELAPTDVWPEVWLTNHEDSILAEAILAVLSNEDAREDWKCGNCGEKNYPSFHLCWHCQHRKS